MSMFCYQCQEAMKNTGCTAVGMCGKKDYVANLQDLLIYALKGISIFRTNIDLETRKKYASECGVLDNFIVQSLFATITNANFDRDAFIKRIFEAIKYRDMLKEKLKEYNVEVKFADHDAADFTVTEENIDAKAATVGILTTENEDVRSLRELLVYGVKGIAAYYEHSFHLGKENKEIIMFIEKALLSTINDNFSVDEMVGMVLEAGKYGVDVMALLDKANTTAYGNPEITEVNIGVGTNPGILISGHDLKDMEDLLKQTEGTGVDVYTHGEMLPAHYYPAFKKYEHFVGNYGGSWWKQKEEFTSFNGPVIFTTNCIVPPRKDSNYADKIYTTGAAGFPGWKHIEEKEDGHKDFSEIIEHAQKCAPPTEIETGTIVGGFAHAQVFALADKVVDAVKSGAVKKFVVMAGCDGRHKERNYYEDFAKALPHDTIILTAGCAKYRYNKLNLRNIGGIPRVLDAGQCNDSYSLAVIALKLKEVFGLDDINDLPIVYNIAWYEQKAVIVLLALLHLGVKNIHLGPTLPAFLSANVANVLVENFGIKPIGEVQADVAAMMAGK